MDQATAELVGLTFIVAGCFGILVTVLRAIDDYIDWDDQ